MTETAKPNLHRREAVKGLLSNRGDMLVVSGLGSPTWDCAAAGDDPRNFYLWGAMGGAVPMGLGLAVAQPGRRVLVITGDGEMLMGLGSLAAAGAVRPENLAVVVLDNEHYAETGMQPTPTATGFDIAGVARAAGFREVCTATDDASLTAAVRAARDAPGPVMAVIKVAAESLPLVLPSRDGAYLKNRFRESVLGPGRTG